MGTCPTNVDCLTIGLQINMLEFLPVIDLIYLNNQRKRPLWAHATIEPVIQERQKPNRINNDANSYESSENFDGMIVSMDQIYDKFFQKNRLGYLLSDLSTAEKYITEEGPTIFQPGLYLFKKKKKT